MGWKRLGRMERFTLLDLILAWDPRQPRQVHSDISVRDNMAFGVDRLAGVVITRERADM